MPMRSSCKVHVEAWRKMKLVDTHKLVLPERFRLNSTLFVHSSLITIRKKIVFKCSFFSFFYMCFTWATCVNGKKLFLWFFKHFFIVFDHLNEQPWVCWSKYTTKWSVPKLIIKALFWGHCNKLCVINSCSQKIRHLCCLWYRLEPAAAVSLGKGHSVGHRKGSGIGDNLPCVECVRREVMCCISSLHWC